jgi:hypothetical protein
MTIAEAIYLLCAATSLAAAALLWRQYRASRTALLLWSCIGFFGLAANNILVYVDLVLVRSVDLALVRAVVAAVAMAALLYGLVWETQE